jgi:hypothetical protein
MLRQRSPRVRDEKHLDFVRAQPCCHFKGCPRPSEAAHIRMACPARGKLPTGMAEKPSDFWTVPICGYHHREGADAQHRMSEKLYWELRGIDPFALALDLWQQSGGAERALQPKPAPRPRKIKARKPPEQRVKIRASRKMQSRGFAERRA